MKRIPLALIAVAMFLYLVAPLAMARDDEFNEAVQQTEEQWKAVRTTMQEGKTKLDDFQGKFKEYREAAFSDSPEKGIELAQRLFNLDKTQTAVAQEKVNQLREMFNEVDKAGLTEKLEAASGYLEKADKYAGEAQNIWEFTKKFDPEHAKNNPTYGLRLIGDLLKESAGKLEKIPLVGQILGKWLKAYGEVAGDFANALDRIAKKIDQFRGGNLCAQQGYRQDQQAAFEAAKGSQICTQYFATGIFPRLRGEVYEGNNDYFLFYPATKLGYFAHKSNAGKVYRWHELLLDRVVLEPQWLADRANWLKTEMETRGREYHRLFAGWKDKSNPGWLIIEDRDLYDRAYFYGRLDEETFVANYVLSDSHHNEIFKIVKEYEKYVLLAGTVYEDEDDNVRRSSGAVVELTLNGKVYKQTTDADGKYEIIMEGKAGDAVGEKVTKEGFDPLNQQGRIPQKVTTGNVYTLTKGGAEQVVISGAVSFKEDKDKQAQPLSGATVTAAAAQAAGLGSATSGGDGSYSLTVQVEKGVEVTCTATKDGNSGAASVAVTGEAHPGVDIVITGTAADTSGQGVGWIINVTVLDDNGKPLPNAVVSCTQNVAAVTTSAAGKATVGPIPVPRNWEEEPFTVTLTPSIVAQGGIKVGGTAASVTYEGALPSAVTLTIPVIIPTPVTASGTVTDANGVGIGGAVVTGGGQAVTVSASGAFSIGPFMLVKDSSVTLTATKTDGTNTWGGAPVTITFDGTNKTISGVTIILDIETETDVTITGRVQDLDGKALANAAVSAATGVSTTTDAAGQYTLPPFTHKLGTSVAITATITDGKGVVVSGQTNCKPMAAAATAPTIVIQVKQEDVYDVTISGTVQDEQGAGISGAVVTGDGSSATTDASGNFSLGPVELTKNESTALSATFNDGGTQLAGGPVNVTFDGANTDIGGVVITIRKKTAQITVTGTVKAADGSGIGGASVSGGGTSATTGGGGNFSLGPIEHELGKPLTISAGVTRADGSIAGGNATVTPTSEAVNTNITIDVGQESDGEGDEDIDEDIDDVEDDIDGELDFEALLVDFSMAVGDLDGIAADFNSLADFFDQRLRELREEACKSSDVSYALSSSGSQAQLYSLTLTGLYGLYGDLTAAQAADPTNPSLGNVDSEFQRCVDREGTIETRRSNMLADYGAYQCDEDQADTESGDKARDDADPDDVESGADDGGGVEVCGDGIDNDGDDEIDECDAGCCDKNVQVTVTDCGAAADDIFLVAVDGGDVGVTPKGAANTFNVELSPGNHTVTVTCLDDGGEPLGTDIGTACVIVVVFGEDQAIGGGEMGIPYGGSQMVSFYVSEGPTSAKIHQVFDGSTLRDAEQ